MSCTVRIASPLRSYTAGAATLAAAAARSPRCSRTSSSAARHPLRMIDEHNRIRPHMRLFVNTGEAHELSATVRDGDTVHVICALSGG